MSTQPPKLLDQTRAALRARHYPAHAEEASVAWIRRFILFHDKRHPDTLTAPDVLAFLNSIPDTSERGQARLAVLFLYRQVLDRPLDLPPAAPPSAPPPLTPAPRPLPPDSRLPHPLIRFDPLPLPPDLAALLDQAREALRVKHYAYRTEQAYLDWIKRYILFHNKRHPNQMGAPEVEAFLTHLAVNEHVAASTQNPRTEPVEVRRSAPCSSSTAKSSR